jgi:hypothetical protein
MDVLFLVKKDDLIEVGVVKQEKSFQYQTIEQKK